MASCDPAMLQGYKKVIDDGYAMAFADAMAMEVERSKAHAKTVTAESVEAARKTVTERGRDQQ